MLFPRALNSMCAPSTPACWGMCMETPVWALPLYQIGSLKAVLSAQEPFLSLSKTISGSFYDWDRNHRTWRDCLARMCHIFAIHSWPNVGLSEVQTFSMLSCSCPVPRRESLQPFGVPAPRLVRLIPWQGCTPERCCWQLGHWKRLLWERVGVGTLLNPLSPSSGLPLGARDNVGPTLLGHSRHQEEDSSVFSVFS